MSSNEPALTSSLASVIAQRYARTMAREPQVGATYDPSRRDWPEAATYAYRDGEHELLLFRAAPTRGEIDAVASGEARFALYVEHPVIVLLYRFGAEGSGIPWSAVPFTIHLVPDAERMIPPADEERAALCAVLVDASTGIIWAVRRAVFEEGSTAALRGAIREQAEAPWDELTYVRALADLHHRFRSSAEFAQDAGHLTTVPQKASDR